jgi:hypothetical protein
MVRVDSEEPWEPFPEPETEEPTWVGNRTRGE